MLLANSGLTNEPEREGSHRAKRLCGSVKAKAKAESESWLGRRVMHVDNSGGSRTVCRDFPESRLGIVGLGNLRPLVSVCHIGYASRGVPQHWKAPFL